MYNRYGLKSYCFYFEEMGQDEIRQKHLEENLKKCVRKK